MRSRKNRGPGLWKYLTCHRNPGHVSQTVTASQISQAASTATVPIRPSRLPENPVCALTAGGSKGNQPELLDVHCRSLLFRTRRKYISSGNLHSSGLRLLLYRPRGRSGIRRRVLAVPRKHRGVGNPRHARRIQHNDMWPRKRGAPSVAIRLSC